MSTVNEPKNAERRREQAGDRNFGGIELSKPIGGAKSERNEQNSSEPDALNGCGHDLPIPLYGHAPDLRLLRARNLIFPDQVAGHSHGEMPPDADVDRPYQEERVAASQILTEVEHH